MTIISSRKQNTPLVLFDWQTAQFSGLLLTLFELFYHFVNFIETDRKLIFNRNGQKIDFSVEVILYLDCERTRFFKHSWGLNKKKTLISTVFRYYFYFWSGSLSSFQSIISFSAHALRACFNRITFYRLLLLLVTKSCFDRITKGNNKITCSKIGFVWSFCLDFSQFATSWRENFSCFMASICLQYNWRDSTWE